MHPPEKHVSIDRMNEILAARTNNVAGPSPKPAEECPVASGPPSSAAPGAEGPLTPAKDREGPLRAAQLEWGKPIPTGIEAGTASAYILSTDGRYSVTKDVSGDSVSYSAWRRLPDLPGSNGRPYKQIGAPLGCVDSGDAAKALCGADAALHA